jgi:hypothetical protein
VAGLYEATSCRSCSTLYWAMETGEDYPRQPRKQIRMAMAYAEVTHLISFIRSVSLCSFVALT